LAAAILGAPLAAASWLGGKRIAAALGDDLDTEALAHPYRPRPRDVRDPEARPVRHPHLLPPGSFRSKEIVPQDDVHIALRAWHARPSMRAREGQRESWIPHRVVRQKRRETVGELLQVVLRQNGVVPADDLCR